MRHSSSVRDRKAWSTAWGCSVPAPTAFFVSNALPKTGYLSTICSRADCSGSLAEGVGLAEASVLSDTLTLLPGSCSGEEDDAFPSPTPLEGCSLLLLLRSAASVWE